MSSHNMDSTLKTMHEIFEQKLEKLSGIWNELGHDESVISERFQTVIKHNVNLLNELVEESEIEKSQILDDIDAALKKIQNLRQRLRITGLMEGYVDTPLVLLQTQLQDLIKQYEREIQLKKESIHKLLQDEVTLCRKLGTTPKKLATKPVLPTPEEISDYERYVERLNQQVFDLEEQFLQIKSDIMQMLDDLEKRPSTDFELEIVNNDENAFILSTENMTKLKQWQKTLKIDVQERRGEINELRQKLLSLWELLEEDTEYRTNFISKIEGIGECTLRALKDEILRCNEKKKAHIKEYIDKYRTDIEKWWENCKYGVKQRSDFMALYKSECYTDDLLMLHELQLEKLKLYYNTNKKIFDLIEKRNQLWQRYMYLSECANNKDRFKNRGGELLREEKERKEVNVQLPQIEKQLIAELQAYKNIHETDFLIEDKPLEDLIHESTSQFREKKTATLSAKKKQRDITMTPNQNGRSILTHANLTASKRKAQPLRNINNNPSTAPSKRSRIVDEQKHPQSASSRAKTVEKQSSRPVLSQTRTVPKIKVNDHTVGKVSYCVRRRLCPTKRLSRESANSSRTRRKGRQSQTPTESSDEYYNQFMVGISSRSSTVHQQKENKTPQKTPGRKSPFTPRTPATIVPRTPRAARTPETPRTVTRLQAASPLPYLF